MTPPDTTPLPHITYLCGSCSRSMPVEADVCETCAAEGRGVPRPYWTSLTGASGSAPPVSEAPPRAPDGTLRLVGAPERRDPIDASRRR